MNDEIEAALAAVAAARTEATAAENAFEAARSRASNAASALRRAEATLHEVLDAAIAAVEAR